MGARKKPGRKPTTRIRQHVMLDPENRDLVKEWAANEGRNFSDQINWMIRERWIASLGPEPRPTE